MILLIDNYDSFVHNLARYFEKLGQATHVVRNDAIAQDEIARLNPKAIVLSPGPCTPTEAGCSLDVVRTFWRDVPILGVCLGHQAIAAAFGARIVRASTPMHGRASLVRHDSEGIFASAPQPLLVGRYHSLVIERPSLPTEFLVQAHSEDGAIMAISHRNRPVVGVQFHPESILTQSGYLLLYNFLKLAGVPAPVAPESLADELRLPPTADWAPPPAPVTF
jgi:anthranilate synthase/aminodeoxychorismate synthase-like glutamine amidotransferase